MKICTECNLELEISDFDIKKNGSVSGYCKSCRRAKLRIHYRNNKTYYVTKAKEGFRSVTLKFKTYKESLSCQDCGLSFKGKAYLCDFHHLDTTTKEFSVGEIVNRGWKKIQEEIKKCIPLCANCHRTRHYQS